MARISRKQLKKDRFAEEVGHQVSYIREHRTKVTVLAVVVIVAVVGGSGFYRYRQQQAAAARRVFQESMNVFHGVVSLDEKEGQVTFATTIEKEIRTTQALQQVIDEYSGRFEGHMARLYKAMFDLELGKYVITQIHALFKGAQRKRMLSGAGYTEVVSHAACSEDQIIIWDASVTCKDCPGLEIYASNICQEEVGVFDLSQDTSHRLGDIIWRKLRSAYLIQQGEERMVVVAVNEGSVNRGTAKSLSSP